MNDKRNTTKRLHKGLSVKDDRREFKTKQKEGFILQKGEVIEASGNGTFKVKLQNSEVIINASLAGKIKLNYIRILVGDKVELEISVYDLNRGRITRRI